MTSIIKSFLKDESGATAIEYGLIAAGIAIAIIAAVQGLGTKLNSTFARLQAAERTSARRSPPTTAPGRDDLDR